MADIDLMNIDARQLIDDLKKAYYNQTGETLQIGSDEFAAAASFAYVWSVLLNNINDATLNRFIDSATGEYLDAIAANYGIESRPLGYHSTAKFSITTTSSPIVIPANSIVIQDSSGNAFTNRYKLSLSTSPSSVVLYAVDAGTKYNGIPESSITEIVEGDAYITAASNTTMTSGGTDGFENDDVYREWLKLQIQSFAGAGTYQAYEARAKNADPRVLDVYVVKQDDDIYQKGKVQIFIHTDSTTDSDNQVQDIVQSSCSDDSFRPIGDLVEVNYSALDSRSWAALYPIQTTYPERFSGVASARNTRILSEYNEELALKIGKPFVFEELCKRLCTKDSDGVYCTDAKTINFSTFYAPEPIYPDTGKRINLTLFFNIQYDSMEA